MWRMDKGCNRPHRGCNSSRGTCNIPQRGYNIQHGAWNNTHSRFKRPRRGCNYPHSGCDCPHVTFRTYLDFQWKMAKLFLFENYLLPRIRIDYWNSFYKQSSAFLQTSCRVLETGHIREYASLILVFLFAIIIFEWKYHVVKVIGKCWASFSSYLFTLVLLTGASLEKICCP